MFRGLIGGYVQRNRRDFPMRLIAAACARYLSWFNNANYDSRTNGEAFVLNTLGRFQLRTVFDVGANVGDWTREARAAVPGASIHSLEICRNTYESLVAHTGGLSGVRCVNIGLADKEGSVEIHYYPDCPVLTTTLDYPHGLPSTTQTAAVTTGDRYCVENGIGHIDLLKIDAEGMDHLILAGFAGMLERRAIDVIQFEYGRASIVSKFMLRDFYELLGRHGYAVGKIYPNFVDFRAYNMSDEDFLGPNYLACRSERHDYLAALS